MSITSYNVLNETNEANSTAIVQALLANGYGDKNVTVEGLVPTPPYAFEIKVSETPTSDIVIWFYGQPEYRKLNLMQEVDGVWEYVDADLNYFSEEVDCAEHKLTLPAEIFSSSKTLRLGYMPDFTLVLVNHSLLEDDVYSHVVDPDETIHNYSYTYDSGYYADEYYGSDLLNYVLASSVGATTYFNYNGSAYLNSLYTSAIYNGTPFTHVTPNIFCANKVTSTDDSIDYESSTVTGSVSLDEIVVLRIENYEIEYSLTIPLTEITYSTYVFEEFTYTVTTRGGYGLIIGE